MSKNACVRCLEAPEYVFWGINLYKKMKEVPGNKVSRKTPPSIPPESDMRETRTVRITEAREPSSRRLFRLRTRLCALYIRDMLCKGNPSIKKETDEDNSLCTPCISGRKQNSARHFCLFGDRELDQWLDEFKK
nr:uncharacterized protein LOC124216390 isoform X2 [Neodiprion pinetum]